MLPVLFELFMLLQIHRFSENQIYARAVGLQYFQLLAIRNFSLNNVFLQGDL